MPDTPELIPATGDEQASPSPKPPLMSTIRTLKGDVAGAVKRDNISQATVALKEAARRRTLEETRGATARLSMRLVIISIFFVVLGMGALVYVVFFRKTAVVEVPIVSGVESLIFADTQTEIEIGNLEPNEIVSRVRLRLLSTDRKIGSVEHLVFTRTEGVKRLTAEQGEAQGTEERPTKKIIGAQDFLKALRTSAPDGFIRALDSAYLYGVHAFTKNGGFFLFTVGLYERAYAELLLWERRSLAHDLLPLMSEQRPESILESRPFEDTVVKNIDARVLRDESGTIRLIYAFLNPKILLVAENIDAFGEAVGRYTTPKPVIR